jgi:regulator of protease activity HflC (stomatin/prohibitin superfamily)
VNPKDFPLAGCGIVVAVLAVVGFLFAWAFCWVTVPKGETGVMSWFGQVQNSQLDPGPHLVSPFKTVYRMKTQTQKIEEPATVPTKGGLPVQIKAVLLYHLDPAKAGLMAREVGDTDYEGKVVEPYFKNAVRDATAEFTPEALYTVERQKVETKVFDHLQKVVADRGIIIESVMILYPVLPDVVAERIKAKVGAEQDVQRMEFVLKQKELEAKTKVVEANGIAEAQKIIKQDLTHEYLVYLWIQALSEGAKHNNAVIYVPTGSDGMPIFNSVIKPKAASAEKQ